MKYWLGIFCLLFACTEPIVQEVNLIPKPQKLEISDGVFSLSFNTNLIIDSLFYAESGYLKELLNLELNGNGNTIELLKKEGLQEEEFFLNISADNLLAAGSGGITDNVNSWTAHSNIGDSSLSLYTTAGPGTVNHLDIGLLDTGDVSLGHNGHVYYINPRSSGSNTIGGNYKNVMRPELFFLRNTSYYLHLCSGLEWNGSHPRYS